MTHHTKRRLTIGGAWTAAGGVVIALGALSKGVLDLDTQSRGRGSDLDSLKSYVVRVAHRDSVKIARLERRAGITKRLPDGPPLPMLEVHEGLVRRMFHILF